VKPTYEVHWTWVLDGHKAIVSDLSFTSARNSLKWCKSMSHIYKNPRIYKVTRERVRVK
jgi:hypothetical protein